MSIQSIDVTHRSREYRINETARENGATIRVAGRVTHCFMCFVPIRAAEKSYHNRLTDTAYHIRCAISGGGLVEVPAIQRPGYPEGLTWPTPRS